jgi:hypothetical protein
VSSDRLKGIVTIFFLLSLLLFLCQYGLILRHGGSIVVVWCGAQMLIVVMAYLLLPQSVLNFGKGFYCYNGILYVNVLL